MATLDLTPDELLSTTRAVRRRLDLERPVERELIEQCVQLAQQAPNGGNRDNVHFVVVGDPERKQGLADLYRRVAPDLPADEAGLRAMAEERAPERVDAYVKILHSASFLYHHMHEVPYLAVPCIQPMAPAGADNGPGLWGSVIPAAWSFMLAARSRGLGTVITTYHLEHEEEAASILGIPFPDVRQAALIPVAHTKGTAFRPGPRGPLERILHWDAW